MSVIPSILRFERVKGESTAPYQLISFSDPVHPGSIYIQIQGTESWIYAELYGSGARVTVKDLNLWQNFSEGGYTGEVIVYAVYYDDFYDPISGVRGEYTEEIGRATVMLTIKDPVVLAASPINPVFNYQVGGVVPNAIQLNITSLIPWTLTKTVPWISLSVLSGNESGTSNISIDPTGLAAGTYTSTVVLSDGTDNVNILVTLNVSEADSQTDYLFVTPSELNFGFTLNGTLPPFKSVSLSASDYQNISITSPSWIQLESSSDTIKTWGLVSSVVQNLSPGVYSDVIIFTLGSVIKTLTVNLEVYKLVQTIPDNSILYFSDDDNIISTSSGRTDTHLAVDISASFEGNDYSLQYNVPFFKGIAKKRLGLEASKMIGPRNFIGAAGLSLIAPYDAVKLNVVIKELEVLTGVEQQSVAVNNLKFLKGAKPVGNWLSTTPREIHVSRKAFVAFSILSQGTSVSKIDVAGSRIKSHAVNELTSDVYSLIYPLEDLKLVEGDQVDVSILNESLKVNIKPDGTDSTMIFWENEHGCWDAVEFTGDFTITSSLKKDTSEFRKDHLTTETKIHSNVNRETFRVNTGFIYTDDELMSINKMLNSRNVYLMNSGNLYNVEPVTNSIEIKRTDNRLRSTTILFKNVLEK